MPQSQRHPNYCPKGDKPGLCPPTLVGPMTGPRRQCHLNRNRCDLLSPIHPDDHRRAVVVLFGHKIPPGGRRRPKIHSSVIGRHGLKKLARGEPIHAPHAHFILFSREVYSLASGVSKLPSQPKLYFPRLGCAIPRAGEWDGCELDGQAPRDRLSIAKNPPRARRVTQVWRPEEIAPKSNRDECLAQMQIGIATSHGGVRPGHPTAVRYRTRFGKPVRAASSSRDARCDSARKVQGSSAAAKPPGQAA